MEKRSAPRDATYRGMIRCPQGHALGVEHKTQLICDCKHKFAYLSRTACPSCGREIAKLTSPNFLFYTYYYSVRDRKSRTATSRVVDERVIDDFMVAEVARRMAISKPLRDWAIRYLADLRDEELRDRKNTAPISPNSLGVSRRRKEPSRCGTTGSRTPRRSSISRRRWRWSSGTALRLPSGRPSLTYVRTYCGTAKN